MLNIQIAKRG